MLTGRITRRWPILGAWTLAAAAAILSGWMWFRAKNAHRTGQEVEYRRRPAGTLTFNKDIAPIVYRQCSGCHRPGQSAPFSLLTYADVSKRAKQIVDETSRGYMPPWLPSAGYGAFLNERRLSGEELGLLRQWMEEGAQEGRTEDLPRSPSFPEGWRLGKPDLVVRMPEPYFLAAEGRDVYRNFVIPVPLDDFRYVEAVEFRPGDTKAIHHTFIRVDTTGQTRLLDAQDPEPGIPGMDMPPSARIPDGQFLSWQPGKVPAKGLPGMAWKLEARTDVILQVHMQTTGKAETIQPSLGFYFTEQAPTRTPFKIGLRSLDIDIPAGATNATFENSYVLPVDVDVLSLLPHAHYLGRDLQGFAILPDGTRRWLMRIKEWDFNWQGDYQYAEPVFLPKGTRVAMRFSYDNSTNNVRNPAHPPRRVRYGLQTTDEMGELWLQVLPREPRDRAVLTRDYQPVELQEVLAFNRYRLGLNPEDARAHCQKAQAHLALGQTPEAFEHLLAAAKYAPNYDEPHYFLGLLYRSKDELSRAKEQFEATIRINPHHYKAHGNLGLMALQQGDTVQAEQHLKSALDSNPRDVLALDALGLVYLGQKKLDMAEAQFRSALRLEPESADAKAHLAEVLKRKKATE